MSMSQTADLALMRELNERIVLNLVRQAGPISRAELARRSNLSRSTVSSIIAPLLETNIVHEVGAGDSQGGRRPIMIEFNYQSSFVIGIELGTEALTLLLTDLAANVLRYVQAPTEIAAGPAACIPQVAALIERTAAAAGVAPNAILGVGVGVPGPLEAAAGRLIAPPIMPGWHSVPLRALLEERLGIRVFLENDANLGALAEQRLGAARGWRNVAYVYLGSRGIGSGLLLDGRLYRGDIGSAGEIGHLMMDEDGPVCRCGSIGCLEAIAGTPALLQRARDAGLRAEDTTALIELARQNDARAVAIIREAGEHLGIAIASMVNMINPGCVVIGGGLAAAGDLLLDPLRATLRRRGLPVAAEHVTILPGTLGTDVVAIGGVTIVIQHAFNTPTMMSKAAGADAGIAHEPIAVESIHMSPQLEHTGATRA
jgi:predicted NBD/HSP70 family sugar kinase